MRWVNIDFISSRVGFSLLRFIASLLCSRHSHSSQTASTPTLPCQARHTAKQDLLWLPLNYTPFYSTVYQSKGGAGWGYMWRGGGSWAGGTGAPECPLHQCRRPPQRPSWQRMSSYNAVAVPAAQSHPIPNCPQRWQIMEGLWSENGP